LAGIVSGGDLRIHLIGVAGSGMSGIAGLLLALGHRVSGSDRVSTPEVERLQGLGLAFFCPQTAEAVKEVDLVVYSSAIRPGNPEYDEAVRQKLNLVRRADALAAVLNCKRGITVAGMHGKTTTSSMAAHVLRVGGLHPSHYVGAEIPILGTNAHWDPEGEYFVAEGDESDGSLAYYHPEHAIILNIEEEHLDYYENLAAIEAVYRQLADQTSGSVFYCADDPNTARLCAGRDRAISYGESPDARYRFLVGLSKAFYSQFKVFKDGAFVGEFVLNIPGRHNISNATAVIALATELGVSAESIRGAFEAFRGARRRFEVKYRSDLHMVVDDYGHHPSEVKATLATARSIGQKRVLVMFQPHRYSRTLALKKEFGSAFGDADAVLVADVYPASERPIAGVTGQTIVDAIGETGQKGAAFVPDKQQMILEMGRMVRPCDLILSLGAGDIHECSAHLAADLDFLEDLELIMGPGVAKLYEPLSKHTTMRVGGPAQFWIEPDTVAGFAQIVRHCRRNAIPLTVIGRGSNLLVKDGGIRGVVARLSRGEFKSIEARDGTIEAGAGVKLKDLAMKARDAGIGDMEWMEGIPGWVGGSLRMNAGAMGLSMFDNVVSVRVVDSDGAVKDLKPEEMEARYRSVPTLENQYAVSAVFKGVPRERELIEQKLRASMNKRRTSQPAASSAGCIFKNPEAIPAGKLIDELGLKGTAVGGAAVSPVHGNFIVNHGEASAADVLALIEKIRETAKANRGETLETEVRILGEERGLHV
jgi:UDP-N-acetylmuramate--L-alanine ligase/UDP-N-acetylenolpyruvoylglucosamine reductase